MVLVSTELTWQGASGKKKKTLTCLELWMIHSALESHGISVTRWWLKVEFFNKWGGWRTKISFADDVITSCGKWKYGIFTLLHLCVYRKFLNFGGRLSCVLLVLWFEFLHCSDNAGSTFISTWYDKQRQILNSEYNCSLWDNWWGYYF